MMSWVSRPPEQVIAALVLCAAAIGGMIYSIRASGRKRTNTKAALALASLLAAWLLIGGSFAALGAQLSPFPVIILALVIFTTVVVGTLLAILAFIELKRELVPREGGLMASLSLGLGSIALLLVGLAVHQVISDLLDSAHRPASAIAAAIPAPATQPAAPAPSTQPIAAIGAATRPMGYPFVYPPQSVVMEPLNLIVEYPGDPWVRMPAKMPGDAAFQRMFPFMVFTITGRAYGDDMTTEQLLDMATRPINPDTTIEVFDRRPLTVNGLPGMQMKRRAVSRAQQHFAVYWACAHRGYLYEMIVTGNADDEKKITEAAPALFKGFYVLDPSRIVRAPETRPLHHESSHFAYRFDLKLPRWQLDPEVAKVFPTADFGATSMESFLVVFPVFLYDVDPSMDDLTDALLSRRPIRLSQMRNLEKTREGDAEVYSFEYVTPQTNRFDMFKAIKRGNLAYLVNASSTSETRRPELVSAIAGFSLAPAPPRLNPIEFTAIERRINSLFLNNLGLKYASVPNVDRAALCFKKAMDLAPDPVVLENLADTYIAAKQYQKAILSINRDIDLFRNQGKLRAMLALARSLSGDKPGAIEGYKEVFSGNHEDDGALEHYLALLTEAGNPGEAISAAEKYLRRFNSLQIALRLARLHSDIGQHARAIDILNQRQKGIPFNPTINFALAEAQLAAAQHNEALATIKTLRTAGQDTAYTDQLQGRVEVAMRRYKEAKISFEASLKKDPHFGDTTDWLKHVTTILGQGDTSNIRHPIEAVAIPAELLKDLSSPPPAAAKESSAYYIHRIHAISFAPGQERRETRYDLIKVLDTLGVERFNTMELEFDPLAEAMYVNKLIVRDGDGKQVAEGKVEDYYTVDQGGEVASQEKRLHITIPGLKPGYSIELVVTRRDFARPQQLRFKQYHFSQPFPCIQSAVVLRAKGDVYKTKVSAGVQEKQIDGGVYWTFAAPPVYQFEYHSPPLDEFLPLVAISDRSATWPAEGREYIGTLTARLLPSPSIKALAQRLTEGLTTDEQKASALLKHVQKELTYKAIAFGPRARMPQTVDEVVQKRFGDCKDHSLLLHHLLTSAGIQSSLALVKSYGDILPDVPSLDQFDHVIVYSPKLERFFDCTAKNLDLARFTPTSLGGSHALVLDLLQPRLVQIPKPAESTMGISRELRLSESGELTVHDVATVTGHLSAGFRHYLRGSEPRRRTEFMQRLVSSAGRDATKAELKIENLEEVDRPLVLDFSYVIGEAFKKNGQQLVGALPAPWDRYYLETPHLEKREFPFELTVPVVAKSNVTVYLPDHYRLRTSPGNFSATDDFASAQLSVTQDGQRLNLQTNWRQLPGRHPASRYSAFQKSMTNIISALEPTLVLEK